MSETSTVEIGSTEGRRRVGLGGRVGIGRDQGLNQSSRIEDILSQRKVKLSSQGKQFFSCRAVGLRVIESVVVVYCVGIKSEGASEEGVAHFESYLDSEELSVGLRERRETEGSEQLAISSSRESEALKQSMLMREGGGRGERASGERFISVEETELRSSK